MARAQRRKYHYIYKITRFDGAYYLGLHSTDDLEDGYFGSGKRLWYSVNKHGKDKHSKEILEFLPDRESLALREKEIVCKELLEDKMCLNIALGGDGGWNHIDRSEIWERPGHREKVSASLSATLKNQHEILSERAKRLCTADRLQVAHNKRTLGKKHSEETKIKMRASHKGLQNGEKNSQYGTCWVTNGKPEKIKKEQLSEYLAKGYSLGRKLT